MSPKKLCDPVMDATQKVGGRPSIWGNGLDLRPVPHTQVQFDHDCQGVLEPSQVS